MRKLLLAFGLVTLAFTSQAKLAAQQIDSKVSQTARNRITDEPWMYPIQMPAAPTVAQLNSIIIRTASLETEKHKGRIQTGTSVVVPADIADFHEIVKWYASKLNDTDVLEALSTFNETTDGDTKSRDCFSRSVTADSAAQTRLRFTTDQKLMTTLVSLDGGDAVSVSLVGNKKETSILILRQHTHQSGG